MFYLFIQIIEYESEFIIAICPDGMKCWVDERIPLSELQKSRWTDYCNTFPDKCH